MWAQNNNTPSLRNGMTEKEVNEAMGDDRLMKEKMYSADPKWIGNKTRWWLLSCVYIKGYISYTSLH